VIVFELFQTIQEIFHKNLGYFLATSSNNEPFEEKLLKWFQTFSISYQLIVIKNLVNRKDVDETTCDLATEGKRGDHIIKKMTHQTTTASSTSFTALSLRYEIDLNCSISKLGFVFIPGTYFC